MGASTKTWIDNQAPECDANDLNGFNLELKNAIEDSEQTHSASDREQLSKALTMFAAMGNYMGDSGSANTYVLSAVDNKKAPTSLVNGLRILFKPSNTNTGASTIKIGSLDAKSLYDELGNELGNGRLVSGYYYEVVYESASDSFKIFNTDFLRNFPNNMENNYVIEPTTNNSFASTASNNPYTHYFDDGIPRYGAKRCMFAGLVAINSGEKMPVSVSGLKGFHPICADTGKPDLTKGFYGSWTFNYDSSGTYIKSIVAGDFYICTDIMNDFAIMHRSLASLGILSIYLNGSDTTNNLDPSANVVLDVRYYSSNSIYKVATGIAAKGINTVKLLKDDTNPTYIFGDVIDNNPNAANQDICVTEHTQIIQGKKVTVAGYVGANCLPLKGSSNNGGQVISGTKGGFVGYYVDKNGNFISKVQEPTNISQAGVIRYNAASSDTIDGLSDSSKFYANVQPNVIRVKDSTGTDRMLLAPSGAGAGAITCANDFDGVADTTLFAGNKQFQSDGVTGSTFADGEAVTVELYCKVGANADHSNEEILKRIGWDSKKGKIVERDRQFHFRDFGANRVDDFTAIYTTTAASFCYTADDGSTSLVGYLVRQSAGQVSMLADATRYLTITFKGTGIRVNGITNTSTKTSVWIDGVCVITAASVPFSSMDISDLPFGEHTLKIQVDAGAGELGIYGYDVYVPKKPVLTENYNYHFFNYVLADYVITNLPTLNLSTYNGAIDQGVIRKGSRRSFVYTGTWTYEANDGVSPAGASVYSSATLNADTIRHDMFSSGNIRFWHGKSGQTDAKYRWNVNGGGFTNINSGANLEGKIQATSMTIGLNSITINHNEATVNNLTLKNQAFDYVTPVWNFRQWRTNPFLDLLIDGCSVIDNRKLSIKDSRPVDREILTFSYVADATNILSSAAGAMLLCAFACDFPVSLMKMEFTYEKLTGNVKVLYPEVVTEEFSVAFAPLRVMSITGGDLIKYSQQADYIPNKRRNGYLLHVYGEASNEYRYRMGGGGFLNAIGGCATLIAKCISEDF